MRVSYSQDQLDLQAEVRSYLAQLLEDDTRAAMVDEPGRATERAIVRRMAKDGWLGVGWPVEWGGLGFGAIEQFIFFEECMRAGAPIPVPSLNLVGPALMDFGTPEQQQRYLPDILAGEAFFSIGYSEPDYGTDLASLKTRATRDGDEYVINGQKTWMSYYDTADYIWLAVRTNPDEPAHKGISLVIVPMDAPGITTSKIDVLNVRHPIAAVYFDDVRIPVENRVAGEGEGWKVLTTALNHERITLGAPAEVSQLLNDVHRWARTDRGGLRVVDEPWVQRNLAESYVAVETMKLMCWALSCQMDAGHIDPADATAAKVYTSWNQVTGLRMLMEVVGAPGYLRAGSAEEALASRLEEQHNHKTVNTFGGGNSESMRDLIAAFGLGLPRTRS